MSRLPEPARVAVAVAAAGAALLAGLLAPSLGHAQAPHAAVSPLRVATAPGTPFPQRKLVLTVPATVALDAARVHIAENGKPVKSLTVSPLRRARAGEIGIVLLIDSSESMRGAPLHHAMEAARALAALRSDAQEVAVDTFSQRPRTLVPLTSDGSLIKRGLASVPPTRPGTRFLPAIELALRQLADRRSAVGVVIIVSDGANKERGVALQTIAKMVAARHIHLFTVGVRDRSYSPSDMARLAEMGGGTFESAASPSQLSGIITSIDSQLHSEYVVRYRSAQPFGRRIQVAVALDGVPGVARLSYRSPSPPLVARHTHRSVSPPVAAPGAGSMVHRPFWSSWLAVVLVALAGAVLVGAAVAVLHTYFVRSGQLRARLRAFIPAPPRRAEVALPSAERSEGTSRWQRLLERRRWWPTFVYEVDVSGGARSPKEWASIAVSVSLLAAVAIALVTGLVLLAPFGLIAGPLIVRYLVKRQVRQQRLRFMEQLPAQIHEIASALRPGRSLVEAVGLVAESADEPVRREFRRVVADERAGLNLDQALRSVGERMESAEIEQVTMIADLHRRTGANIAEVLDRVADAAQQRVDIRRELRTLTAQARLSRNVLTALPLVVLVAIGVVGRSYERPLLHTTGGLIVLGVSAAMVALGANLMKRIVDVGE